VPLTFDLRARPLLVLLLLVVAAASAGLFLLGRMHRSSEESAKLAATVPKPHRATAKPAVTSRAAPAKPTPATQAPSDRLPAAIRLALAADRVVVVALYDPKAKIDGTALLEARAGAKLAGSAFVPVDVRRNAVEALNARYGVIQDPALLVLRPPGDLVVRIDGFADRDTVAQAAVNAGP
jgi:hypothetical protein